MRRERGRLAHLHVETRGVAVTGQIHIPYCKSGLEQAPPQGSRGARPLRSDLAQLRREESGAVGKAIRTDELVQAAVGEEFAVHRSCSQFRSAW